MTDKVAFYHIPKTGGMFVSSVMFSIFGDRAVSVGSKVPNALGLFDPHNTPSDFPCGNRFSFSFVRNPTEWYRSRWSHAMWGGWQETNHIGLYCKDDDFDVFVNNCLDRYPKGLVSTIYERFTGVDFIGKYENLTNDLIRALILGHEEFEEHVIRSMESVNVSKKDLKDSAVFKKGTLKRLKKIENYAYERFEYA